MADGNLSNTEKQDISIEESMNYWNHLGEVYRKVDEESEKFANTMIPEKLTSVPGLDEKSIQLLNQQVYTIIRFIVVGSCL